MLYRKPTLAFSALRHCLFVLYELPIDLRNMMQRVATIPSSYSSGTTRYFMYYEIEAELIDNARKYLEFLERRERVGMFTADTSLLYRCIFAQKH